MRPPFPVSAPGPPDRPATPVVGAVRPPAASPASAPSGAWPAGQASGLAARAASVERPTPAAAPSPSFAGSVPLPPGSPASVRAAALRGRSGPGLGLVAPAALVVALIVAALWVAIALQTGLVLPELAVVVGIAAGLMVRRTPRVGGVVAALVAGAVALVAIAAGLLLASLAVYSSGHGVQFLTAVGQLSTSFLPHLENEAGVLGAALAVAGVVVAALVTVPGGRSTR